MEILQHFYLANVSTENVLAFSKKLTLKTFAHAG